jgi:hypothetical protein
METEETDLVPKIPKIFFCEICHYECSNKKDYSKHLSTRKHEKSVKGNTLVTNGDIKSAKSPSVTTFTCKSCTKIYKSRKGLWSHQKKCEPAVEESSANLSKDDIKELLKQNQEFKELIIDQNNKLFELAKEGRVVHNNTTNNTTNNFNLNMFLNEKTVLFILFFTIYFIVN